MQFSKMVSWSSMTTTREHGFSNAVTVAIYTSVLSLQCNGRVVVIQHLTKAIEAYDKTSLRESSDKRSG